MVSTTQLAEALQALMSTFRSSSATCPVSSTTGTTSETMTRFVINMSKSMSRLQMHFSTNSIQVKWNCVGLEWKVKLRKRCLTRWWRTSRPLDLSLPLRKFFRSRGTMEAGLMRSNLLLHTSWAMTSWRIHREFKQESQQKLLKSLRAFCAHSWWYMSSSASMVLTKKTGTQIWGKQRHSWRESPASTSGGLKTKWQGCLTEVKGENKNYSNQLREIITNYKRIFP